MDVDATKIHLSRLKDAKLMKRPLPAFCVDIGAPKSIFGRKELNRIFVSQGISLKPLLGSRNRFRFADATFKSIGRVKIPLATLPGIPAIPVTMDVVDADIPALLGLDALDKEFLVADTVANRLTKRVPVKSNNGPQTYVDE